MSSVTDLATIPGVLTFVAETQFASIAAVPLVGGHANYTFRLYLRRPYRGRRTAVLKHAKPYIPAQPDVVLPLDRQIFEVAALLQIKRRLASDSFVTVPDVFLFDSNANAVIMSDCGDSVVTLMQLLQGGTLSRILSTQVGEALGDFFGKLHFRGMEDKEYLDLFAQNEEGKKFSAAFTYGRLLSTLTTNQPHPNISKAEQDILEEVARNAQQAMITSKETVIVGDLWPGNILIVLHHDKKGTVVDIERIYVVDWEVSKSGLAGMDIGQFCAELYLLRLLKPENEDPIITLLTPLLQTYGQIFHPSKDLSFARIALVHMGEHLVVWTPRVSWGSTERKRDAMRKGVNLIIDGRNATEEYIKSSILSPLFL